MPRYISGEMLRPSSERDGFDPRTRLQYPAADGAGESLRTILLTGSNPSGWSKFMPHLLGQARRSKPRMIRSIRICGSKVLCGDSNFRNIECPMAIFDDNFLARFWSYVKVAESNECWEWTGARHQKGYGRIRETAPSRFTKRAHIASLELKLGRTLRSGLFALHTCDNTPCCNPEHLYEGTALDNARDAIDRDRLRPVSQPCEQNGNHVLLDADIPDIIVRIRAGHTNVEIAADYGVHHGTISQIRRGKNWKPILADLGYVPQPVFIRRPMDRARLSERREYQFESDSAYQQAISTTVSAAVS